MTDKYLVSACLTGEVCRYDGKVNLNERFVKLLNGLGCEYYTLCPEVLGGLPTPRPAAEIEEGDGRDVLSGKAFIFDAAGRDVTANFIAGAKRALDISLSNSINKAILNERSPSCGVREIYRGGVLTEGMGVTAALLSENGIAVQSDEDFLQDNFLRDNR